MFKVLIATKSAAFASCPEAEIFKIIKEQVIPNLRAGENASQLSDSDGNNVGYFEFTR